MKFIRKVFIIIFVGFLIFSGIKINEGYELYKEAINEVSIEDKVTEIRAKKNYTKIDELPEIYKQAVVATEDNRFYVHNGFDLVSTVRAIWIDIKSFSFSEGGSTITQQLAKNTYFTQEKKIKRKIAEIYMAFEFEKKYSKEEILELYLNTCYFGEGCYTVREASKTYFSKEPLDMTEYECIMLAGIPNAPSVYAPTVNPELAKERLLQVIKKMISYNVLTENEAQNILNSSNEN